MSATSLSSELLTVTCKDGDPTAARRWQAVSSFTYPAIRVSPKGSLHGRFRTAASIDFQMTDIQGQSGGAGAVPASWTVASIYDLEESVRFCRTRPLRRRSHDKASG